MTETELIIKLVILFIIFSAIYTTIKAIVKGVREGVDNARDIMAGTPAKQMQEKNKKKQQDIFESDLKKMESRFYRITHPLEFINCMLLKKIREKVG